MKRAIFFLLPLFFLVAPLSAEPYAPVVPRGAHVKVPDRSKVDIPPYPGAQVYRVMPGVAGKLPNMDLLSTDPPRNVVSFYSERLDGWKKGQLLNGWVFRKPPYTKGPMGLGPGVHVLPADPDLDEILQGVKTHIRIWYGTPE